MSANDDHTQERRVLTDEITEEALGQVTGGADGDTAEPAPAPAPAPKCKKGDPSCTDATHPYGDW